MQLRILLYMSIALVLAGCSSPGVSSGPQRQITITNSLDQVRKDVLLNLEVAKVEQAFKIANWERVKILADGEPVPFETIDSDGDGSLDRLMLLVQMDAGERKSITVADLSPDEAPLVFPKRTQAEISHKTGGRWEGREYMEGSFKNVAELHVPEEHTDHSWFIRYEGPGWESDLVGYRFYLDWRNATDIFGKKTSEMVLDKVGLDGFDSYHEPAAWGQDILKVGKSLGIGSIGTWKDGRALRVEETDSLYCAIVQDGLLESVVRTEYHGWKVGSTKTDLTSLLSIHAGSRLTKHEVSLSEDLENLCTGIGKLEGAEMLTGESEQWGYLATWGNQSLAEDNLGMAVIFRKADRIETTEDAFNYIVVLRPEDKQLSYYFLGAWEQEPGGIKSKDAFLRYLDGVIRELDNPLDVQL